MVVLNFLQIRNQRNLGKSIFINLGEETTLCNFCGSSNIENGWLIWDILESEKRIFMQSFVHR